MSFINTANLSAGIEFTAIERKSLTIITDLGAIKSDTTLTQGTGNSQCDSVFHATRSVASSGSDLLDLQALSFTLFDKQGTINFHNVKGISIRNPGEETNYILNVIATGSNAFTDPFNGGSGNIPIYPTSDILLSNPIVGWSIDSTHKNISIRNTAPTGLTYEICVVGVTG
jgi:hypothetical protein